MSTSPQRIQRQIIEKVPAQGGRVGGPFERMLRTLRDEQCRTLAAASRLHPQIGLATPSRIQRAIHLNRTLRGISPSDVEKTVAAPSPCRSSRRSCTR